VTENALSRSRLLTERSSDMKRRRFKHIDTLQDRLAYFAKETREKASKLPPGPQRDELIRKADRADTAAHLDEWASSSGLRPPR
jgi:hypothetical protein